MGDLRDELIKLFDRFEKLGFTRSEVDQAIEEYFDDKERVSEDVEL